MNEGTPNNNLVFDKNSGNFIVTIRMSPEQHGRYAQEEVIPDLESLVFEKVSVINSVCRWKLWCLNCLMC